MKVQIKDIKPNPFKKFINGGKLDKDRVEKLKESIEHGTLPSIFYVRKNEDGTYELAHGHHRLEAMRQVRGNNFEVPIEVITYNDETMLVDMIRENLVQRDTDFRDTEESIVLARNWLGSGCQRAELFGTLHKEIQKRKKKFQILPNSNKSIAKFLSKQGKTISDDTIRNYLQIYDNLAPELHEKVMKLECKTKEEIEKGIGLVTAFNLATIKDKDEQRLVAKKIKEEKLDWANARKTIARFKKADKETKKLIKSGALNLSDLKEETPLPNKQFKTEIELIAETESKFQEARNKWISVLLDLRLTKIFSDFSPSVIKRILSDISETQGEEARTYDKLEKYIKSKEVA